MQTSQHLITAKTPTARCKPSEPQPWAFLHLRGTEGNTAESPNNTAAEDPENTAESLDNTAKSGLHHRPPMTQTRVSHTSLHPAPVRLLRCGALHPNHVFRPNHRFNHIAPSKRVLTQVWMPFPMRPSLPAFP